MIHSLPYLSTFSYCKGLKAYQYTLLQASTGSSDIWNSRAHNSSYLQLGLRRLIWQWSSCTRSPTRLVMQHPVFLCRKLPSWVQHSAFSAFPLPDREGSMGLAWCNCEGCHCYSFWSRYIVSTPIINCRGKEVAALNSKPLLHYFPVFILLSSTNAWHTPQSKNKEGFSFSLNFLI